MPHGAKHESYEDDVSERSEAGGADSLLVTHLCRLVCTSVASETNGLRRPFDGSDRRV